MTGGECSSVEADGLGVSTSKDHKSGSGFSPGRLTRGRPGSSNTSASSGIVLKGETSTPTALMLPNGMYRETRSTDVIDSHALEKQATARWLFERTKTECAFRLFRETKGSVVSTCDECNVRVHSYRLSMGVDKKLQYLGVCTLMHNNVSAQCAKNILWQIS